MFVDFLYDCVIAYVTSCLMLVCALFKWNQRQLMKPAHKMLMGKPSRDKTSLQTAADIRRLEQAFNMVSSFTQLYGFKANIQANGRGVLDGSVRKDILTIFSFSLKMAQVSFFSFFFVIFLRAHKTWRLLHRWALLLVAYTRMHQACIGIFLKFVASDFKCFTLMAINIVGLNSTM